MTFLEDYGFHIVFVLIGIGMLMTLIRVVFGPKLQDRFVALDTFNVMVIGVIGLFAVVLENKLYLDIALVYGLLAFLETIVFSRYLEVHHDNR